MWNVVESDSLLNCKKYAIPTEIEWMNVKWKLKAGLIYVTTVKIGHYISIVHTSDGWKKYDDDKVETLRERYVPTALRNNTFGLVYGLFYTQVL